MPNWNSDWAVVVVADFVVEMTSSLALDDSVAAVDRNDSLASDCCCIVVAFGRSDSVRRMVDSFVGSVAAAACNGRLRGCCCHESYSAVGQASNAVAVVVGPLAYFAVALDLWTVGWAASMD